MTSTFAVPADAGAAGRRRKLLVILPSLARGGAERVVSLLTREWSRSHYVVVVAFNASRPAYGYHGRVLNLRLPVPPNDWSKKVRVALFSIPRLLFLFIRERPDVILSFMEPANFPAAIAAAVAGMRWRLIVSVRHNPAALPRFRRVLMPWIYRLPRRVVVASDGARRTLLSFGVPDVKLTTIPNPVACREQTHVPVQMPFPMPYIMGAGRLIHDKGFDRLLQAFALLQDSELHLVILGEGEERAGLRALAKGLSIAHRVSFLGAVSDLSAWYQYARCFVLASRNEGWPNVLLEAMANGCPTVSFCCDYGPSEIIEDQRNGILVPEGDVEALARALARVLQDSALRRRLARGGMRRTADYSAPFIAACWLAGVRYARRPGNV